ncbi:LacI family DNA-binding transcriptional regulator [Protaetiibacter mangrovi]|uniref:LacI family transcriptional regulator n=1 Tax=Protaetiibacter mangrovi TaxID=2970926 RepID=A0ABT1ZER5_9MICO|nr:LacI family DNA-binding transcriptional regulator [Protaetiibacter mangrovi]MCS0499203.1 LacI family transcriptional regulator [Protaetiibacter mangrovi]
MARQTPPARRPTLEMVAAEAGVTRSTVSRALNGEPDVSQTTIAHVRVVAARMGYVPNRAAKSLASARSMAIALVIPEPGVLALADPHLVAVMAGVSRRIEQSDYLLNLMVAGDSENQKIMRYLTSGVVDGVLVASQHSRHDALLHLHDLVPVVFSGRPTEETDPPNYFIDVDNAGAAGVAVSHLLGLGRRRIATITGPEDMAAAGDRTAGWRAALASAGLPADLVAVGDWTALGGAAAMRTLLDEHPDIDGVFAANDVMAAAAVSVLLDAGRRVPEDVAVVGFDDSSAALSARVPLTTMSQPSERSGELMADLLLRILAGEQVPISTVVESHLVRRESA